MRLLLLGLMIFALHFSYVPHAYAGFLSQFFANVASDSLQNQGRGSDPLLKEKKIQAALAVMSFYQGKLDGDFDTFESRTGIKKFQKAYNLEETGFLSELEKSQLTYLSNLFTDLKKKGVDKQKKVAIYDEIDSAKESILNKTLIQKYLPFLQEEIHSVRIIAELEDADVYVNGQKVSTILLGYSPQNLQPGSYDIKVKQVTEDKEWLFSGSASVDVSSLINVEIDIKKEPTEKRTARLKEEARIKEEKRLALWNSKAYIKDDYMMLYWEDMPKNASITGSKEGKLDLGYAKKFCQQLAFAKSENWRMPTFEEAASLSRVADKLSHLQSIKYYKKISKGIMHIAKYDKKGFYAYLPNTWHTDYIGGRLPFKCVRDYDDKITTIAGRRSKDAQHVNVDKLPNDIYVDSQNKLMWQLRNYDKDESIAHSDAKKICQSSKLLGFKNWQLPSSKQMNSLQQYPPYHKVSWYPYYSLWVSDKKNHKYGLGGEGSFYTSDWYGDFLCVRKI